MCLARFSKNPLCLSSAGRPAKHTKCTQLFDQFSWLLLVDIKESIYMANSAYDIEHLSNNYSAISISSVSDDFPGSDLQFRILALILVFLSSILGIGPTSMGYLAALMANGEYSDSLYILRAFTAGLQRQFHRYHLKNSISE